MPWGLFNLEQKWAPGGSLVVRSLAHKSEGRGFETKWGEIFNISNSSLSTNPWGLLNLWQKWVPRGSLEVKPLASKSEGRGFDSQ
jgi:hypothetical protein